MLPPFLSCQNSIGQYCFQTRPSQISFHGLRHTHATILISSGENIKVVSERLGHTDIKMTLNTYTHVMENMKSKTANLLDDIFE